MLSKFDAITKKELLKLSTFIAENINLALNNNEPSVYLTRIINKGAFQKDILGDSLLILKQVKNLNAFQGKSPQGIAAAAIYIVAKNRKLKISQEKIAKAAKISRKSLSLRVKEINSVL